MHWNLKLKVKDLLGDEVRLTHSSIPLPRASIYVSSFVKEYVLGIANGYVESCESHTAIGFR
jgi:hypothetical protein